MNSQTVIGIFDIKSQASKAVSALQSANFNTSNIDVSTFGENGTVGSTYSDDDSGVFDFFNDLFGNHENNRHYADVVSRGTIVTVHTQNMTQAKEAAAILDEYGSIDLDERVTAYRDGTFDASANSKYIAEVAATSGGRIDVVKEDIAVGKREVETGGVTVRSRIVEKPVQETLRLRYEEVFVDRKAVDRPANAADFATETITVKETAEEAVVAKDARVVEEITIGKDTDTRTETIHETVRETEVEVVNVEGEEVREYESKV